MKTDYSIVPHDPMVKYGYLAFVLTMLHLVRRGTNKHVARENMASFFLAMLPTELSHKFIAVNAAVIYWLRKSKTPILAGWVGSIAGVVQCVVVLQLARMYQGNITAKHSIRAAMTESDIPADKIETIGDINWRQWLGVLLPIPQQLILQWCYPSVKQTHTLEYAHVGKNKMTRLLMDVYKHSNTSANAPIFLYVHGGGWIVGNRKNPPLPLVYQVATLGWVVCVIDYRLSPKIAFPGHLIDIKRAIAFLRRHASVTLGADPDFIVVGGESAGGHLASLVALTSSDKSLQPGFEDVDTSVRGCIDTYGVHDFKDRHGIYFYKDKDHSFVRFIEFLVMQKRLRDAGDEYDNASPIAWLSEEKTAQREDVVPPFLVSHGTHDTLVPFDDSYLFFEQLQRYRERNSNHAVIGGVKDIFLEIQGAHHAFNYLVSPRTLAHGEAVCAFLDNLYQKSKNLPMDSEPVITTRADTVHEISSLSSLSSRL